MPITRKKLAKGSSDGLLAQYGKWLLAIFGSITFASLSYILISGVINYYDYKKNFGAKSQTHQFLQSRPNMFAQDTYELLLTLHKLENDCLAHKLGVTSQQELTVTMDATRTKFNHFLPGTAKLGNWEEGKSLPSYKQAIDAVSEYLNEADRFVANKSNVRQLTTKFDVAIEAFTLLNSDWLFNSFRSTDELLGIIDSFAPLAHKSLELLLFVVVIGFLSSGFLLYVGLKMINAENSKLKDIELLIASIGHDLRSPLQAIRGASALLSRDINQSDRNLYSSIIKSSIKSLDRLIDDILQMVERKELDYVDAIVDVRSWFEELAQSHLTTSPINNNNNTFKYTLIAKNAFYEFDSDRIAQIVDNLVDNAFKYTNDGQIILMFEVVEADASAHAKGDANTNPHLRIEVKDTGVGISDDDKKKIFKPFERGMNTAGTNGKGLGLSIIQAIVSAQGGTITVESKLLTGSTFVVTMPIKNVQASSDAILERSSTSNLELLNTTAGAEILLVDDDKNILETISGLLCVAGFSCHTACNGQDALEMVMSNHYQVLLTDIQMSGMDGIELAAECKKLPSPPYLIAMTAHDKVLKEVRASNLFNEILTKPTSEDKILEAVEVGIEFFKKNGSGTYQT